MLLFSLSLFLLLMRIYLKKKERSTHVDSEEARKKEKQVLVGKSSFFLSLKTEIIS
jgi:hypothetical protein